MGGGAAQCSHVQARGDTLGTPCAPHAMAAAATTAQDPQGVAVGAPPGPPNAVSLAPPPSQILGHGGGCPPRTPRHGGGCPPPRTPLGMAAGAPQDPWVQQQVPPRTPRHPQDHPAGPCVPTDRVLWGPSPVSPPMGTPPGLCAPPSRGTITHPFGYSRQLGQPSPRHGHPHHRDPKTARLQPPSSPSIRLSIQHLPPSPCLIYRLIQIRIINAN